MDTGGRSADSRGSLWIVREESVDREGGVGGWLG